MARSNARGPRRPQRVRDNPRISVNKLAEYLDAPARRRHAIIRDQKYPSDFQVIWYERASSVIVDFLCERITEGDVVAAVEQMKRVVPTSDSEATKLKNNALALERFLDGYAALDFDGLRVVAARNTAPKIEISGVEVSVRPELILKGRYRGKDVGGAVKLYFAKDTPLSDEGGLCLSSLVYFHIEQFHKRKPSRRHSQVLDVFAGHAFEAPTATTARLRNIEAACAEIRDRWPEISQG